MNNSTNASLTHYRDWYCDNVSFFHDWADSQHVSFRVAIITMFTLGLIGNITTVAVISCWRKLHTPTFTMLACLAVSDACSLLAYTPNMYTNIWRLFFCNYLRDMYMKGMVSYLLDIIYFCCRYNAGMQLCILAFCGASYFKVTSITSMSISKQKLFVEDERRNVSCVVNLRYIGYFYSDVRNRLLLRGHLD